MAHTLDVKQLSQVFEALRKNQHKLTTWECDRLEEWEILYARGWTLSDKQIACLEKMYVKV